MADIKYVDVEDGLKRVLNNTRLYIKMLNRFKAETSLEGLAASLEAGDFEKARVEAHALKGLAANLSLPPLYKEALNLETGIKSRLAGGAMDSGAMDALTACFAGTIARIGEVTAEYGV